MPLHLVFPGLLWPQKALRDTAFDLELPALGTLLGRGRVNWQPPVSLEAWLCREFGIMAGEPPVAALRLLGEGESAGNDVWLCADFAHLGIDQGRPTLTMLDPDHDTRQKIAASLAPHFQNELGGMAAEFFSGRHHYLRLASLPEMISTPPSAVIGRAVPSAQLKGIDAPSWLRLGNEMQMLLHALPVNREREAQGLPVINTLWFWGAGALPAKAARRYEAACGDHPLLQGLAAWAGIPWQKDLPQNFAQSLAKMMLIDALQAPAQELDAEAWRQAVKKTERDILQPVQALLKSGRIANLRITALGEEACLDLHIKRSDLFKFWRRPVPLHELAKP